jgi:2-oxoglutarate dehydrogenase E2 component (dihydrolipoamide succinyltransferase)
MTDVIMPQMGESIAEGTVTKWYKKVGEHVERDEPLLEISTDKVDTEIPAPVAGILSAIKVQEGETVEINTVVGVIGGEVQEEVAPVAPTGEAESTPATGATQPIPPAPADPKPASPEPEASEPGLRSSPLVRKMAREHGLDLSQLTGTGRGGRVTKQDIENFLAKPSPAEATPVAPVAPTPAASSPAAAVSPPPSPPAPSSPAPSPPAPAASPPPASQGRVNVEPMSKMRKSIAEHMVISQQTSAHVTTVFEADVSRIVALRNEHKPIFERDGVRLTYTPFFVAVVLGALKTFPLLNASIDGDTIVYHRDYNIGIAVALEGGLIVPVIQHADEKSFLGLARAVNDVGERARTKKLMPADVQGGTFTLTNPGPFGGLFGTPIINQPQVAILGVGGIHKRPVVVNDGIAVRSMVYLALSFDHRLIDGALGDQFMADVKRRLEGWDEKLL